MGCVAGASAGPHAAGARRAGGNRSSSHLVWPLDGPAGRLPAPGSSRRSSRSSHGVRSGAAAAVAAGGPAERRLAEQVALSGAANDRNPGPVGLPLGIASGPLEPWLQPHRSTRTCARSSPPSRCVRRCAPRGVPGPCRGRGHNRLVLLSDRASRIGPALVPPPARLRRPLCARSAAAATGSDCQSPLGAHGALARAADRPPAVSGVFVSPSCLRSASSSRPVSPVQPLDAPSPARRSRAPWVPGRRSTPHASHLDSHFEGPGGGGGWRAGSSGLCARVGSAGQQACCSRGSAPRPRFRVADAPGVGSRPLRSSPAILPRPTRALRARARAGGGEPPLSRPPVAQHAASVCARPTAGSCHCAAGASRSVSRA